MYEVRENNNPSAMPRGSSGALSEHPTIQDAHDAIANESRLFYENSANKNSYLPRIVINTETDEIASFDYHDAHHYS